LGVVREKHLLFVLKEDIEKYPNALLTADISLLKKNVMKACTSRVRGLRDCA
jgi:hypothetical protein